MELSLVASRSGPPACRADGVWLHSRFDPSREAERFASAALEGRAPCAVVLLGPCLGYLGAAVRRLLPGASVISIQHSSFFRGREVFASDSSWYPDSGRGLEDFLDSLLDEDSVSGVAVLSWPPAESAFPEPSRAAAAAIRSSLNRLSSSAATVKVFGRRWIANACRGFLLADRAAAVERGDLPVVVAAAGPSLAASLKYLAPLRGSFALVAVSSALAACRAADMEPDLVVATDGGYWSRLHLYPLAARRAPLASPLVALPSASLSGGAPFLFLDQGGFAESELLPLIGAPPGSVLGLPPHGTVSGTALILAARLFSGPVIAAGLDLARRGDLEHARPHGFDALFSGRAGRLDPEEGARWSRAAESAPKPLPDPAWRSSRSLESYASGLDTSLFRLRGRLYRMNPSPVPLRAFEDADAPRAAVIIGGSPRTSRSRPSAPLRIGSSALASFAQRAESLRGALSSWRALAAEASEALASGRLPSEARVGELLRSIDIVDYAAARRAVSSGGDPRPCARELGRRAESFLSGLAERLAP